MGLHHVEINMIMNTPEKAERIPGESDGFPGFSLQWHRSAFIINEKVGTSDTLGIYIRPEYPVYSTK